MHSYYTSRQPHFDALSNTATDPINSVTLLVFVLVALTVSRLSARVTGHARESESWGGQMHDLYEFTRRTLQMNLHMEPGPQLAELVHEIFALEAVAVFDADLHNVYQAGYWSVDPLEMAHVTVIHNGVLVQDNVEIEGITAQEPTGYKVVPEKLPLHLQDHHNPVRYRNIWVRELGPGQ
jgi:hypothetical protein